MAREKERERERERHDQILGRRTKFEQLQADAIFHPAKAERNREKEREVAKMRKMTRRGQK